MATLKRNVKPTTKQLIALKLRDQGMSKRKAALQAGYSKLVANNPKKIFESRGVQSYLDKFYLELKDQGVTTSYLAKKYAEWLQATGKTALRVGSDEKGRPTFEIIEEPDYKTQVEAGKMLKEVYDLTPHPTKANDEGVKRRITLEEFIGTEGKPIEEA